MKKIIPVIILLLLGCMVQAQVKPDRVRFEVNNGKFTINNKLLSKDWTTDPALKLIGFADKQRDGYNKTHTYNQYGIVLFESTNDRQPSGKLAELQVYFSEPEEESNVAPNEYFSGAFLLENLSINKDLSADQLRSKLTGYKESDSYMAHNFRFSKNGIYLYFLYDQTELRLIKVSVGKDKRKDDDE